MASGVLPEGRQLHVVVTAISIQIRRVKGEKLTSSLLGNTLILKMGGRGA